MVNHSTLKLKKEVLLKTLEDVEYGMLSLASSDARRDIHEFGFGGCFSGFCDPGCVETAGPALPPRKVRDLLF